MPKYKIENYINPVSVAEQDVEAFLEKYPNATLVEEQIKEEVDFPTSTAADAGVVQPMTASQAEYVEPKDTDLPSVDTSLESPDPEPRYIEFKSGNIVYEDTYLKTKAGKPGYPATFDQYAAAFGSTPKNFSTSVVEIEATPLGDRKIPEELRQNVVDIYKKRASELKPTEFGTLNYDDQTAISNFRNKALDDFVGSNEIINEKIVPLAKLDIKSEISDYEQSAKTKYDLNDPSNITQENIDLYTKDVSNYYNKLLNSKIKSNPEFKKLINDFNTVMDETGEFGLKRFTKGKDWELGLRLSDLAEASPYLSENLVALLTKGYTSGRGVFNQLNKSGQYGGIKITTEKIKALDKSRDQAKKQEWTNETEGYWIKDDSNEKGSYFFRPKFQGALKSKDGVSYRDNADLVEQRKPAGAIEGSWGQFQQEADSWIKSRDEQNRKNLFDIQQKDFVLSAYDEDEFKQLTEGKNIVKNTAALLGEQLPQMGLALITLGASGGVQIGSSIYAEGIDNRAREIFNLPEGREVSIAQKREVMMDDKFMNNLAARATSGGFLAGQLDRFGAGKVYKNFILGGAKSMLRGGMNNFLKRASAKLVNNTITASTEAITEGMQEVIEAGAAGSDINSEQIAEAAGTGLLVSLVTGVGGNVRSQTLAEVESTSKIIAGKLNPKSAEAFFNAKIQEVDNDIKTEKNSSKINELKEKRQSILDARNANLKIPSNFSPATKEKVFDLVIEKQNIEKEIKNKDPELVKSQADRIKEINTELNVISSLETQVKTVEKLTKDVEGLKVESLDNAEAISNFIKENNIDVDSEKASQQQGFIYQNPETGEQTIIINKEVAAKEQAVNVAAHEFLHGLIFQTVKSSPETQIALGKSLNEYINKIDATQIKDSNFAKRLESYKDMSEANQAEEVLTLFSDAIATGDIQFNESVFTKIGDIIRRTLQNLGVKVKFNEGRDVYNFVKDYNKSIEKGRLTKAQKAVAKTGAVGALVSEKIEDTESEIKESKQLTPEQDTQLRSDVAEINKEASEGEALAKKFNKDFVKGAKQTRLENKVLQEIKPIVDRVVTNRTKALYDPIAEDAKKNVSRQMFQESMRSDIESMVFDEFTGKQDLEKFIVNRAFLRANNLAERLGIKGVEEGITKGLEAAEKVAVEETTAPKADKPKYRNILKSNTLPTETVNTIKDKVLKTVRTLKSKLDTKVSKNKTVTPLIAEIKKNMGKQADIDFKKAMGGKKDGQIKRFLIKNKKTILENMTTTWLMGAMPGAVQKQVNGSFTSDWQGKKIDREKTSTQQAGRTSGAEIVRRLPNAFKNLDDKTYLSYIIDESGAPIRGRKESLAKAMAEELSFDIFTAELQNENSDIRKAFEGNQEALGVVLADNFLNQVTKDVERGTVKFSKAALPYVGKLVKLGIKNGIDEVVDIDGNILVNISGIENIDTTGLGNIVRKAFDIGLVPDGKELRFLQSIQASKIIPQNIKDQVKRAITSKSELSIRKALATDMVKVANTLGSDVTDIIGFDGLGFFNRLLDSAKTKKDKITGEIIPGAKGEFFDFLVNLKKKQPKSSGLPNNYNAAEVSPMNSKTGVMGKISRILNKDITAKQKMKEYEKFIPEIEAANVQNKILAKYIITKLVNLVQDGSISPKSFISILQAQTNATAGLRSLTGLKYITFKDGPQGNMKGEHLADNGTSMFEIAELGFENNTKKELSFKIDGILEFHDQWLENREILDFVDQFGKNNPNKDLRIRLLANKDQAFVYTYDLRPAKDLIAERESAIKSRNILEKSINFKELNTVETGQQAINNGNSIKFSKSPKKIRVFDFDDTLARTKSNVLYTMPGEIKMFHGGDIKSVKDINGFVYFSEDQKQAAEYAKGNEGDVNSFAIKESEIASEDIVYSEIERLGLKPKGDFNADELNLYELIDPSFNTSLSETDLTKLAKGLKRRGVKAVRFTDMNLTSLKNDIENIVVIDKSIIKEQRKLTAAEFATRSNEMIAEGVEFDFSEFSKVMDGKKGPLFEVAKKIADAKGAEDVFVLTARPQDAAGPIQEFLSELGLDIPLKNITGLSDGNPKAKADWMVGKVAEGYNDFYFADDAIKNVKAVKDIFDTFDIKGKVQQAKVKFSKNLDKGFNDMIERQTGTESFKEFSKGVAQRRGKKVGKFKIFVSPSAEDFRGLTQYKFAGKGKQGEADQKFFEEALMDPYFQGVAAVEAARETIKNDTKALFKIFKPVKKKLNKLVPGIDFTYDGAVRVFLWNKAGIEIPGLTERDNKKLNDAVANDPELSAFADALLLVSKQETWPAPTEYWEAKTTLSDLNTLTEKTNRKKYLTEFIENVDIIFSEKNLNKVEALYGKASRTAIENAIYAMKTGSNSPNQSGDGITNRWLQWVNNSIGTIMFFNRRSALLQLTSATNFLNWSDNNPAKAALAFANQPQYWKDWTMIFNSDKLKQRRSGLKSDVQEAEIANAAKNTEDKIGSIIAYLLKIGFSPTQIADSIAISSGGATFYRNRVNTYKKQGLDVKEAETKAFEDMSKLSDEAQQSGDPALVSQQQRSVAGRLILSFQNTTMQYTRLMKKAGQDLINGRGDAKTHVSKILYYGALQNFIFNALSQTAFALIPGFDDDDNEDEVKRDEKLEEKASRVLNGMTDSIIRGTGIYGAVVTTIKNTFKTWEREADKGFVGDQAKTILEAANISPAIGSKLRKIYSAIQAYQFDKAVMEKHPWSVTIDGKFNPSATYSVIGNLASATLNLPLDRALAEARGVAEMFDNRNSEMQRLALALGWRTWNVGADNEEFDLIKMEAKAKRKEEGKIKAKETRAKKKRAKRKPIYIKK